MYLYLTHLNFTRVHLNATPDLMSHFKTLAMTGNLPSLDALLQEAALLVNRYASQEAYEQSLSAAESRNAPEPMKVKPGPVTVVAAAGAMETQANEPTEVDPPSLPTENIPKVHQEADGFDGDRVLANSILFLQDFGWWIEISYAVPEGDIGRAFEILKVRNLLVQLTTFTDSCLQ